MFTRRLFNVATFVICFTLLFGMAVPAMADSGDISVVASGLNNPRGLNFGPDGRLYVAEAGSGGDGLCAPGPEGPRCYGDSSSITAIDLSSGSQKKILTGLPSLAGEDGSAATGVHDVSFQGLGGMFFTIGFGGDPQNREAEFGPAGAALDQLGRGVPSGNWKLVKDLGISRSQPIRPAMRSIATRTASWPFPANKLLPMPAPMPCSKSIRIGKSRS